jgi:hypothetical protein
VNPLDHPVVQCRHLVRIAEGLMADLEDAHRGLQFAPGGKTAGWLLGHLAVTGDFALRLCGQPPRCPKEWRQLFNPGTQPSADQAVYPPMAELRAAVRDVYQRLIASAPDADPSALAAENPLAWARPAFPTSGVFLVWMLTGHLGYHLGQLSGWRAAAGLGSFAREADTTR